MKIEIDGCDFEVIYSKEPIIVDNNSTYLDSDVSNGHQIVLKSSKYFSSGFMAYLGVMYSSCLLHSLSSFIKIHTPYNTG